MGVLNISTSGSFPTRSRSFQAIWNGHAHAVAQAIEWLSSEVLPDAIAQDHLLHEEGAKPANGFVRPERPGGI